MTSLTGITHIPAERNRPRAAPTPGRRGHSQAFGTRTVGAPLASAPPAARRGSAGQLRCPRPLRVWAGGMAKLSSCDFFTDYGEMQRYTIHEVMGKGSYGTVVRARGQYGGARCKKQKEGHRRKLLGRAPLAAVSAERAAAPRAVVRDCARGEVGWGGWRRSGRLHRGADGGPAKPPWQAVTSLPASVTPARASPPRRASVRRG